MTSRYSGIRKGRSGRCLQHCQKPSVGCVGTLTCAVHQRSIATHLPRLAKLRKIPPSFPPHAIVQAPRSTLRPPPPTSDSASACASAISTSVPGSPFIFANISAASEELAGNDIDRGPQTAAAKLRQMVSAHTPDSVGALLHTTARSATTRCASGSASSGTSTWSRPHRLMVDMCGVEFGGVKPAYVQPAFPLLDNLVFMLPTPTAFEGGEACQESGVAVLVSLAPEVMVKLVKDEALKWQWFLLVDHVVSMQCT